MVTVISRVVLDALSVTLVTRESTSDFDIGESKVLVDQATVTSQLPVFKLRLTLISVDDKATAAEDRINGDNTFAGAVQETRGGHVAFVVETGAVALWMD